MKAYDTYGNRTEETPNRPSKPFGSVCIGETFVHSGRILIKIEHGAYQIQYGSENPALQEINAIRIGVLSNSQHKHNQQVGRRSCFSPETVVEVLPNAAIYIKG